MIEYTISADKGALEVIPAAFIPLKVFYFEIKSYGFSYIIVIVSKLAIATILELFLFLDLSSIRVFSNARPRVIQSHFSCFIRLLWQVPSALRGLFSF